MNIKDNYQDTALMIACQYNYNEIVKYLLKNKANANDKNNHNFTILMLVATQGNLELVRRINKLWS